MHLRVHMHLLCARLHALVCRNWFGKVENHFADIYLVQNSNISLYICKFCFKTAIFHCTYAYFASKQQYFIIHMNIFLQHSNISLYICKFCFKTAIFHYTYANFASKQQYFIVHMHILLQNRNISLYICKFCGILPSSRPPGSIPAFFLPARNDPSILPARQDRSQRL